VRWLRLGEVNIQASELMKLAVIVALARFLHTRRARPPGETATPQVGKYRLRDLLAPFAIVFIPVPLILLQPDLGTTLIIIFIALTMLAVEGIQRRASLVMLVGIMIFVPVAWKAGLVQDYQKDRVYKLVDDSWEKVDQSTGVIHENRRTQAEQAMWAIGSGGLTGQGRRQANTQRMKVFPEVHTDFISAMVAEEFGFLGLTVLLFMFWWLVMWGLRTALDSRDRFCRLVCTGVAALFGWQVFVNVGMVTGFLPVVGVPLPFLSYGGSAFLSLLMCLGLVLNIARKRGRR
jgi:rod shape determining protein RodA